MPLSRWIASTDPVGPEKIDGPGERTGCDPSMDGMRRQQLEYEEPPAAMAELESGALEYREIP